MQWNLEKVLKSTYRLHFSKQEDMCSVFWRPQEYYESPKFRKASFTFEDYKKWYSEKYGNGEFTYMTDWHGFNIPSKSIKDVILNHPKHDFRKDDLFLFKIYDFIKNLESSEDFYIIGTFGRGPDTTATLNHELCHAMWAKMPEYKREAKKLIQNLPKEHFEKMKKSLLELGYRENVVLDEANAYWSTGIHNKDMKIPYGKMNKFKELFKKYKKIAKKELENENS